MANIDAAEVSRFLNASLNLTAYPLGTAPIKLALDTAVGNNTTVGTEVAPGANAYARQSMALTTSSAGSNVTNSAVVSFVNMPPATTTSIELYDSATTPRRAWWGLLGAPKTTAAGDTLSFAVGAVSVGCV